MQQEESTAIYLPFIVFWVGQRCTMHCKHCCNLIPYRKQVLYDVERSLESLTSLSQVAQIGRLQIQGGEPLTHPRLPEIIDTIASLPIEHITMTTNGTILFSDELLATLQKYPRFHVTLSNYDVRKETRAKVMEQLREHNISHSLYDFLYGTNQWFYAGDGTEECNDNDDEVRALYDRCANKICWTLAEGKLAVCGKLITLNQSHDLAEHDAHNILDIALLQGVHDGGGYSRNLLFNLFTIANSSKRGVVIV